MKASEAASIGGQGETPDWLIKSAARQRYHRSRPLKSIPREERKEVILDRIVDFLKQEGPDGPTWTFSHLARAANVSRVTLYGYFGDLDGLRAAVRFRLVGRAEPIVRVLDEVPREIRHVVAVSYWMNWIAENRPLAIRALWLDDQNAVFEAFVADTANTLIGQVAEIFLGVKEPSRSLKRQIEVYLRAAEACLRMWLLEGRMSQSEVKTTIERLTGDVIRMGASRSDVPHPIPMHLLQIAGAHPTQKLSEDPRPDPSQPPLEGG